jgi:Tfp pilus assembly protein PilN
MGPDAPTNNLATPVNKPAGKGEFTEFSDRPGFNFAIAICWLVALAAILATLFFWFMDQNSASQLQDKTKKKSDILSQINSPSYVDVETKANEFKASVNALSDAKKNSFSMSTFLKDLYTKVTSDVVLTSIAVSNDGTLSLSGSTDTYRSVADLMMALKSWDTLESVDMSSVSNKKDEKTGKIVTSFAVSAKIVKSNTTAKASTGGSK